MKEYKVERTQGLIWSFQVISGIVLAIILVIHFWVLHYSSGDILTYEIIAKRLSQPWYKFIDTLFLALVLYHGLNGARQIFLDFNLKNRTRQALFIILTILAIVLFLLGFKILNSVIQ